MFLAVFIHQQSLFVCVRWGRIGYTVTASCTGHGSVHGVVHGVEVGVFVDDVGDDFLDVHVANVQLHQSTCTFPTHPTHHPHHHPHYQQTPLPPHHAPRHAPCHASTHAQCSLPITIQPILPHLAHTERDYMLLLLYTYDISRLIIQKHQLIQGPKVVSLFLLYLFTFRFMINQMKRTRQVCNQINDCRT